MEQKVTISLTLTRSEAETLLSRLDEWQSMLENREERDSAKIQAELELVWLVRDALSEALRPQHPG